MTEEQQSQLIKLAGEMVRGQGMPVPDIEDLVSQDEIESVMRELIEQIKPVF